MLVRASLVVLALGLIALLSFHNDAFAAESSSSGAAAASAAGQSGGANVSGENEVPKISGTRTIKIDTIPRVANVIVDDTIYLSTELPLKFDWKVNSRHKIEIADRTIKNGDDSRHVFDMWTDQSKDITKTVTVKDNVSLRAMFKEQNRLKINSDVGTVQGGGWYDEGEIAQFSISGKNIIQDGTEHRYIFEGWSDGNSKKSLKNSVTIDTPMTINANWKEQYYLQLTSYVSGKSIPGSGWYDKGQKVSIITDKEFQSDSNTKYVFDRWDVTGNNAAVMDNSASNVGSLTINSANTVTANWKKFYFVSVLSQYGTASGSGYYEEGSMADISVTPTDYTVLENKRKAVFDRWTGVESQNSPIPFGGASGKLQNDGASKSNAQSNQISRNQFSSPNAKIKVDKPMTLVANWKDQYFLTLNSKQGLVSGSGWYTAGQTANIEVTQPSTPPGIWLRYMFDGWSGDYQGELIKETVVMTGPKTISAKWKEDYSPAVMNSMIMAGVGAAGFFVYKKTKKTGIGMTIADKIRLRMSHVDEPIHEEEVYNEKWERKMPRARTNYNPTEYQYALFAPRTPNRVI